MNLEPLSLQVGAKLEDELFILVNPEKGETTSKKEFFRCLLKRGGQEFRAVDWDRLYQIEANSPVRVKGDVTSFRGSLQIRIKELKEAEVDATLLLPQSSIPLEAREKTLNGYISLVKNPFLLKLLKLTFGPTEIRNNFLTTTGATKNHHACVGGLAQHTFEVVEYCRVLAKEAISSGLVNEDLLLTAALLHDIDKTTEYEVAKAGFDRTTEGKLLGHISLGVIRVANMIDAIPDFPADLRNEILHCIAAHHGQLEWGSPVEPSTLSAIILHLADLSSARIQSAVEALTKGEEKSGWMESGRTRLWKGYSGEITEEF